MSNEFKGSTLAEAIHAATAPERRIRRVAENKNICSDLAIELGDLKREATRAEDRAESLRKESEALAESAKRDSNDALFDAAFAAAGYFGSAARAWRRFRSIRNLSDLRWGDYLSILPGIGAALSAALNALNAVRDSLRSRALAQQAREEQQEAERLGDEIVRLASEYGRSGCDASRGFTS